MLRKESVHQHVELSESEVKVTYPPPRNNIICRFDDRAEVLLELVSRIDSTLLLVLKGLYSFKEERATIAR
jgi:hypothetical protein